MTAPAEVSARAPTASDTLTVLALFLVSALAARALFLGQPLLNVDDQFYLLVGDRVLQGALPYVDIWDRKPPLLFAIYAGIRLLGGDGVWQYQLVAIAFIVATAFVTYRLALRLTGRTGALVAGVAYTWWTALCGGATGQSPVFYNLPMAGAALLIVQMLEGVEKQRPMLVKAMLAMLLAGLAVQIKQTAVIEAAFFGITLLAIFLRAFPRPIALAMAVLCGLVALLPSLAIVLAWYTAGHLDALLFATVTSPRLREPMPGGDFVWRLVTAALMVLPLYAFAVAGWRRSARLENTRPARRNVRLFLGAWLAVSVLALATYGFYIFDHYLLPTLVAASVCAAPAFDRWRQYRVACAATALAVVVATCALQWADRANSGGWRTVEALRAATQDQRNCPFVFDGPTGATVFNHWCLVTPFAFEGHLSYALERDAIGVNSLAEVRRILDTNPDRIILRARPDDKPNLENRRLLEQRLGRDYRLIAAIEPDGLLVYALRPGHRRAAQRAAAARRGDCTPSPFAAYRRAMTVRAALLLLRLTRP